MDWLIIWGLVGVAFGVIATWFDMLAETDLRKKKLTWQGYL